MSNRAKDICTEKRKESYIRESRSSIINHDLPHSAKQRVFIRSRVELSSNEVSASSRRRKPRSKCPSWLGKSSAMWEASAVRVMVVTSWVREPRSRSINCEATSAIELLNLSTSDVSCVATGNGVTIVGGTLELVVEGGDPGEEIGECGACGLGDYFAGGGANWG
jgi:hypothetical protein